MSLHKIYQLEKSYAEGLDKLLHDGKYIEELMGLQGDELRELIDYLSEAVNRLIRAGETHRKCLHILRKISSTRGVLPSAYEISGILSPSPGGPTAHGGFCDAHQGFLSTTRDEDVCIKKLRLYSNGDRDKFTELFCKEAIVWKHLTHQNVVPFKGVTLNPPQLVSEWMPGGELREYLRKNPDANPIKLLLGVAEGLSYLHSCDVLHGDLKGPNILVDASGNARITDFGLASVSRDPGSIASTSGDSGHTPRWTAPEIFRGFTVGDKKSDVFSFAMVVIEVFSGAVPFPETVSRAVQAAITRGDRPDRPIHPSLTDALWKLTQRCWGDAAQDRPQIEDVVKELRKLKYVPPPNKPREPPGTIQESSSTIVPGKKTARDAPKLNVNGHDETIPYDVDASSPGQTPSPMVVGKSPPAPKVIKAVGRGTTNEPLSKLPSTVGKGSLPASSSEVMPEDGRGHYVPPKRPTEDKEHRELEDGKRRKRPEGEGKREETGEVARKAGATLEGEYGPSGDTTVVPIPKTNVIPASRPTSQGHTSARDIHHNVHSASGSADRPPAGRPSSPSTLPSRVDSESEPTVRPKDDQSVHRPFRPPQPDKEKADKPKDSPRQPKQPATRNRSPVARDPAHPLQLPSTTKIVPYETPEAVPKKPWWKCCC